MSVVEFFREPRVRGALTTSPPAVARTVLHDFFQTYGLEDCSPDQLLALSDLAFRSHELDISEQALVRALDVGQKLHIVHYKLGRLHLALADLGRAAEQFELGTKRDPSFPHNWFGLARIRMAQGDQEQAGQLIERFATFGVRPHGGPDDLGLIADHAVRLFDRIERARAFPLFRLLAKLEPNSIFYATRAGESALAAGDPDAALAALEPLAARNKLDRGGRSAYAHALLQTGRAREAAPIAEGLMAESDHEAFPRLYLDAVIRSEDEALLRHAVETYGDRLPGEFAQELSLRRAIAAGKLDEAAAQLEGIAFKQGDRIQHLLLDLGHAALQAGEFDRGIAIADRLLAVSPGDLRVQLFGVDANFRLMRWERAGEILASVAPENRDKPHVVLKRFEQAAFVGDTATAIDLQARIEAAPLPNRDFLLPIFRFLAERKLWDQIVDRAVAWIGPHMRYEQIGYLFFRAAKFSDRQAEMVRAIEAVEGFQTHPGLVRLRNELLFDRADTASAMEALQADPLFADPAAREKLAIKYAIWSGRLQEGNRPALFLCSNQSYLGATVVALHSALQLLDRYKGELESFIVVDDDLVDRAQGFTKRFAERGFPVTIVPAAHVVDEVEELYAEYGLFTSGHTLASAAYYRIYLAKYLHRTNRYGRAVYIDSDVVLRRGFETLFSMPLDNHPLAARLEPLRPDVRRAIAHHGFSDNRYFNSGVLAIDMKSERLEDGLDGAIAAIADDETTLLYHDQCALNLGFRRAYRELDQSLNFPVRIATKLADIPANAAVLHFTDRPKPWSAAYGGECGPLWYEAWREAALFVGEATARELFSLSTD